MGSASPFLDGSRGAHARAARNQRSQRARPRDEADTKGRCLSPEIAHQVQHPPKTSEAGPGESPRREGTQGLSPRAPGRRTTSPALAAPTGGGPQLSHPAGLPRRERAHLERAARRRAGTERTRPPAHPRPAPPLRGLAGPPGRPPAWDSAWCQPNPVRLTAAPHSPSPSRSGSNRCGRSPAWLYAPGAGLHFPQGCRGAARQ